MSEHAPSCPVYAQVRVCTCGAVLAESRTPLEYGGALYSHTATGPLDPPNVVYADPKWHPVSEQITACFGVVHIKCEHAIKCRRCGGDGEVAGNAARTVPPVICPSCGGTGFKRHAIATALAGKEAPRE